MPLPDILTESLQDPKKRLRTPPFAVEGLSGSDGATAAPAPVVARQPDQMELAARRLQEQAQADRDLAGKEPAPAKGAKAVGGTIASILGSLVNPQIGQILSQRILHPGQEQWLQQMKRAEEIRKINHDEMTGLGELTRAQDMRLRSNAADEDRDRAFKETQQKNAAAEIDRLTGAQYGGQMVGDTTVRASIPMQQGAGINPLANLPGARVNKMAVAPYQYAGTGTKPVGDQDINPKTGLPYSAEGSIRRVPGVEGATAGTVLVPTPESRAARDLAKTTATKRAEQDVTREGWLELPADVTTKLKLPAGFKVPPNEFDSYLAKANPKPTAADEKLKFQNLVKQVSSEGLITGDALTDVRQVAKAIKNSKTLKPEEKDDAMAYLAANNTPSATGTNTIVRVEGMGNIREFPVLDTKNNNAVIYANANEVNAANRKDPGRFVPTGPGIPALKSTSLMEDIRGSINNTRSTLAEIPEFTRADKIKIAFALKDRDPKSAISSLLAGAAGESMDDKQQMYLIQLANLHEQALAMRSALGAGQGSDDLRAAIARTIPGPTTPNKAYALTQLDQFEKTVNRLSRGIPSVPLREQAPVRGEVAATPTVTTKAQYDALPAGAMYIEDGKKFRKP